MLFAGGQGSSNCDMGLIAYEFLSQVWENIEGDIADSRVQIAVLTEIIGTLVTVTALPENEYDAMITKSASSFCSVGEKVGSIPSRCPSPPICFSSTGRFLQTKTTTAFVPMRMQNIRWNV